MTVSLFRGDNRSSFSVYDPFSNHIKFCCPLLRDEGTALSETQYEHKLASIRTATRDDGFDRLFTEHTLDALVGITVGPAWTINVVNGDAFHGPSMSRFPAIAGNPHFTVPMGKIDNLPIGLSLVRKRFQDDELAQIAHVFELCSP